MFLHSKHFCLIWKWENVGFNQISKELKDHFKIVYIYITEENVYSQFKYKFLPKRIESLLTNFIVYDLETHNADRAGPYNMTFYRLSKLAGKHNRNSTPYEMEKCEKRYLTIWWRWMC